jgi:transcriptional regulator with XRE-family HTH domain
LDTIFRMASDETRAAELLRAAREQAGLSLRAAAALAGTSHATLAAYEHGRKTPRVGTYLRLLRAYGYSADIELSSRVRSKDGYPRGRELEDVLALAEQFPARHAATLAYPRFGAV